jgi:nucleoside-triphosphatase THEP1
MEFIPVKPLNKIWLKASVLGSIWASIEIILGSFLHNIKLPLSGMVLSFISVWLLISFFQFWKEKGLIWRAGLICALMKSISPSAIIFGPMIGILSEALILELFIFIFGKNIIAYSLGGAFAVLSTLAQKLLNFLILYGFNFIKILEDLYKYLVKQINIEQLSPIWLLAVVTGIYITAGIAGAVSGFIMGSQYRNQKNSGLSYSDFTLQPKNIPFSQTANQSYSVILMLVNLISITLILLLINSDYIITTALAFLIYTGFCVYNYRNSLRRLKRISFWISFLVITFAAAFLWSGFQEGAFFSYDGLTVGLKMNARAIIMVLGFTSISVELRNPVIKSLLYHQGFASLYQSMNLAFSALPFLISDTSAISNKKRIPGISFRRLFLQAEVLFRLFEKDHLKKPQVVIITGEVHQGKTTFAQEIVNDLLKERIKIAGFLATAVNENGERKGFNLYDIEKGESYELCSDRKTDSNINIGKYYFNEETIIKGNKILDPENLAGKQLIVIDEIGPLELRGQGWSSAIENINRHLTITQLWIIRKDIINKITRRWNTGNIYIYDIPESSNDEVKNKLREIIYQKSHTDYID